MPNFAASFACGLRCWAFFVAMASRCWFLRAFLTFGPLLLRRLVIGIGLSLMLVLPGLVLALTVVANSLLCVNHVFIIGVTLTVALL